MDFQRVIDIMNQMEGACEKQVIIERRHLFNPFYWVFELLTFILRIPFLLIRTSGFHVEKFEEQFWGRFFKLIELIVILSALVWMGASKPEIKSAVLKLLHLDSQPNVTATKTADKSLPTTENSTKH
jgi:hypothetical protein